MDKNAVYVLGTGFSKAIHNDMPLLKDLSEDIYAKYKREIDDPHLIAYKDNVEELLSYLYSEHPWKKELNKHNDFVLYLKIAECISNIIKDNQELLLDPRTVCRDNKNIEKLITTFCKNKTNIITFNYDTIIENLLNRNSTEPCDVASLCQIPVRSIQDRVHPSNNSISKLNKNDVHLMKMHGSIHWYYSGDLEINIDNVYYDSTPEDKSPAYQNLKADLNPFIIPPIMDKSEFYKNHVLKTTWYNAYTNLKGASSVVIIGYSIPLSDYSSQMLLRSAIQKTADIIIVNEDDTDGFKTRMKKTFEGKHVNENYICKNALNEFINKEI